MDLAHAEFRRRRGALFPENLYATRRTRRGDARRNACSRRRIRDCRLHGKRTGTSERVGAAHKETARELAYRIYSLCERKKWADEALAYNSLVTAWPELTKLALAERTKPARRWNSPTA